MRFLDFCQKSNLDPFDEASHEAHRKAQRQLAKRVKADPIYHWLRELRRRDKEVRLAADRLAQATELAADLPGADLTALEEAHTTAERMFYAHGAQRPELRDEFLLRAEIAALEAQCVEQRRAIAKLQASAPTPTPEPLALTAEVLRLEGAATLRRTEAAQVTSEASELDRQWQALHAEPETNWLARDNLKRRLDKAATRITLADRMADTAERAVDKARERAVKAYERWTRANAKAAAHPATLAMAQAHLVTLRESLIALRSRLPAETAAPLTEPRGRFREPVTPTLHPVLRERYNWEPATETLTRRSTGNPVTGASVIVGGIRIARAALIEALCPSDGSRDSEPFNPYSIA